MLYITRLAAPALLMLAVVAGLTAQDKGRHFVDADGVAIGGYDVVSYFADRKATQGRAELATHHEGVEYHFSTAANLAAFKKSPAKFQPQYGGWCAFAMGAKNTKFEANPKTFKIVDGKLYLFYNGEHGNTLIPWNKDEASLKQQADANWSKM